MTASHARYLAPAPVSGSNAETAAGHHQPTSAVALARSLAAVIAVLLVIPLTVEAQPDPSDHAAHHIGAGAPMISSPAIQPPSPAAPAGRPGMGMGMGMGMGGMMGAPPVSSPDPGTTTGGSGCGGMGCMGGVAAKPFYPALMDMPSLTPQARRFIETEAAMRLGIGSEAITTGQDPLHHALSANDPAAIQQAVAGVREGVLLVRSGASALQAVNEGQQPRQIALSWFKGQMQLPVGDRMVTGEGPWGFSWYHLSMMAFLIAFMLGAILIHYARARRIEALVQRLTPGAAPPPAAAAHAAPVASSPAPASVSAPPTATAAAIGSNPKPPAPGMLRVAAIFDETPNVKTFRLMSPDRGPIPFTFLPGQFLTFSIEIDGKPIRRSYTIASSPTERGYVELTIKREDQGLESRYLHDNVAVGDHLNVSGPSGVFTFTGAETDSIVLIAGGVGITPMMCVIRYLTDRSYPGDIFLLYGARASQDFIFREELGYLRKRHANLHIAATMSREEGTAWTGAKGPISKEFIAHSVPDIARRRIHICGPPPMLDAVRTALAELGVTKGQIKTEAFGPAKGAVPAAAVPATAPRAAAPAPAPATPTNAAAIPSAHAEVEFSKAGKTGPLAPDTCVLEAAEAIGVAIDFSCRVGTCGICAVPLLKGAVTMEVEDGLPPGDKARGIILACQAKSVGNLVVEA